MKRLMRWPFESLKNFLISIFCLLLTIILISGIQIKKGNQVSSINKQTHETKDLKKSNSSEVNFITVQSDLSDPHIEEGEGYFCDTYTIGWSPPDWMGFSIESEDNKLSFSVEVDLFCEEVPKLQSL